MAPEPEPKCQLELTPKQAAVCAIGVGYLALVGQITPEDALVICDEIRRATGVQETELAEYWLGKGREAAEKYHGITITDEEMSDGN